jgi:hypothetical protein
MRARLIAALTTAVFFAAVAGAAAAGPPETFSDSVTFLGDSVTAGFGYCGSEGPSHDGCRVNREMGDSWYLPENSLGKCKPSESKGHLSDACSNDNFDNGEPWEQPPWTTGEKAPLVAYPYQLAAGQSAEDPAAVADWAVTGATPANWDPTEPDAYGRLLGGLNHQYVVMTLGANPLLFDFIGLEIAHVGKKGKCVGSTGYSAGWPLAKWYARPIPDQLLCLEKKWAQLKQAEHLVHIYDALLAQGDRVVVLGYYRACNWSFGNWQSLHPIGGPADGRSCKEETRALGPSEPKRISQWEQAVAVGDELDNLVAGAVEKARASVREKWPNTNRADNIVFTKPDPALWEAHRPNGTNTPWTILNDTWIHPSKAGAANLAETVAKAMCTSFGHWCGDYPEVQW